MLKALAEDDHSVVTRIIRAGSDRGDARGYTLRQILRYNVCGQRISEYGQANERDACGDK